MNILSFAIRSISRSPRRTLTLIFSIILSLTLLIGTFLAVEYLGQEFLAEILENIGVDIEIEVFVDDDISNYMNIIEELEKIDEIENVEAVVSGYLGTCNITKDGELIWPLYEKNAKNYTMLIYSKIHVLCFRSNFSSGEIGILNGTLDLIGNNIAVTAKLAEILKLQPGDKITFSRQHWKEENGKMEVEIVKVNFTVCAVIEFEGRLKNAISGELPSYQDLCFIVSMDFAQIFIEKFNFYPFLEYWVFVDYGKVLNPWSVDWSIIGLRRLEREIEIVLHKNYSDFSITNILLYEIKNCRERVYYLKFGFGSTILPVMLLAFLFILTANQILTMGERREIGLLKVRGATNEQILSFSLVKGLIIGGIGGIVGSFAGYLASMHFIKIFSEKSILSPEQTISRFFSFYLEVGVGLGIVMSTLATYISVRKTLEMELPKLMQEYLEEVELPKKISKRTLIIFIMGIIKVVETILNISVAGIIGSMEAPESFIVFLVGTVILLVDLGLIPLGPIFFIYGLIKIVTYYSVKFHKIFKTVIKPLLGELSDLVTKNFSRKTTRTIKITVIMSTVLIYGIAIVTIPSLMVQQARIFAEVQNGADILAEPGYAINETQLLENLSKIEDIELMSRVMTGNFMFREIEKLSLLVIVDENYFNVSYFKNSYLKDVSIAEVYGKFKSGENCCLINEYLKDEYGFKVGEQLNITVLVGENVTKIVKLRVIGIIKALPGIVSVYVMKNRPIIVISYNYMQNNMYIQKLLNGYNLHQYLINVSESVNSTEIAEKLEERVEIRSATSIEQVMQKYLNDPLITIFSLKFCYIEYIFALTIATLGLSLLVATSILEREKEVGLLIVRGMTRKQIVKMVFGEALLMIMVSSLLGIVGGLSIAYGFYLLFVPLEMRIFFINEPIAIPCELYVILSLGIVTFLVASLTSAWYVVRRNLAKMLRICH